MAGLDKKNLVILGGLDVNFKEDLIRLSSQITERKQHIHNEEMTKQALIIPFLQVLGYDVFNPLEVMPEYVTDIGRKKGEKVDYAVFKNGNPIMFIEAKLVGDHLKNHGIQLARYFNATPEVRFALLTNGTEYKFYTDLDRNNVMDDYSFIKVDITNLTDVDIEILSRFRKEEFVTEELINYASELVYTSNINKKLKEIFKNPPDEFVRYLIKDFSDARLTANVIEKFRPIVKKSISLALLDIVSQGILKGEAVVESAQIKLIEDKEVEPEKPKRVVNTTENELMFFNEVKDILHNAGFDTSELGYKDTTAYFGIYNKNILNWFLRINLDSSSQYLITKLPVEDAEKLSHGLKVETAPKGHGESRVYIQSFDDFKKTHDLIKECYNRIA